MPNANIDSEITALASKMNDSTVDSKQRLFDTILTLGPEGLKKAAQNLSPEENTLLKSVLEEMKKAATTPQKAEEADKLTPETTKTDAKDMKTESLTGSDNQDEKIMEDKNKDFKHQGGPKDSPLEGQVIKGREAGMEHRTASGAIIIGHTSTGKPMYANAEHPAHKEYDHNEHKEVAKKHYFLAQDIRDGMSRAEKDEKGEIKDKEAHKQMYGQAKLHEKNAVDHHKMGSKKEDAFMEKCYSSGMVKAMKKAIKQARKTGDYSGLMKSYENFMTKAEEKAKLEKKQGVPEGVDPTKWERGVKEVKNQPGVDNPYAIVNAAMTKKSEPEEKLEMKKAKKIKKSLKKIVKLAKSLKMTKEEVVKAIKDNNHDLKLVKAMLQFKLAKSEGMDAFTPNPEVNQVQPTGQDKKEPGDTETKIDKEKGSLEIKSDATADQALAKLPSMEKSIKWDMKNSIGANTLGRNTHYEVDAYIVEEDAKSKEIIKAGKYFGENQEQEKIKKSSTEKVDLNDLIEKGFDYSTEEIQRLEGIRTSKPNGIEIRKSFHDKEIAAAMGMSEAEYKKLMGE